jgi:hypothetical protein
LTETAGALGIWQVARRASAAFGRFPAANRLCGTYGEETEIITIGEPVMPNEAYVLAEQDGFQCQRRVLGLVGAQPVEQKKSADHGIDGRILFRDDPKA